MAADFVEHPVSRREHPLGCLRRGGPKVVRRSASQNCLSDALLNRTSEHVGRRLLLYPRGSAGAPPGFASLFLDSTAEERVFALDKVDFTLVLHGNGTLDVTKSALRLQRDCFCYLSAGCSLKLVRSLKPPLHDHGP